MTYNHKRFKLVHNISEELDSYIFHIGEELTSCRSIMFNDLDTLESYITELEL